MSTNELSNTHCRLNVIYFSPTGSTKKVVDMLAQHISPSFCSYDCTDWFSTHNKEYSFDAKDIVILGTPVYSGRVPKTALNRFSSLQGNKTPAILIVTYGNRHYDDALFELKEFVLSKGFHVIAAAAFVTEHSVVPSIGQNRPDTEDESIIVSFAQQVKSKLENPDMRNTEIHLAGNKPYRKYQSIPCKPQGNRDCIGCMLCYKKCPEQAVSGENPRYTIRNKCVSCMRCVRICPVKARKLSRLNQFVSRQLLEKKCRERKQPDLFI